MDRAEVVAALKAQHDLIVRLSGVAIAHQLLLARLLITGNAAQRIDALEREVLDDVRGSSFGDTDDASAMEVRRRARDEVLAVMSVIRGASPR